MKSAWSSQLTTRSAKRSWLVVVMIIMALIGQSIGLAGAASARSDQQPAELSPVRSTAAGDRDVIFPAARPNPSVAQPAAALPSSGVSAPAIVTPSTTITLSLFSTPFATHDSNSNNDPSVWVVEAVLTNTGSVTATTPVVNLNMNPNASWYLLPGEAPTRTLASIAPGAAQVLYWFAHRSNTIPDPHTYTVTVAAANIQTVTQRLNAFFNPAGQTVATRSSIDTGNNGIFNTTTDVRVGVAFTVTVGYDLGSNPSGVTLQPVGNLDFNAGAYRLLRNTVQFGNAAGALGSLYHDRTYFAPGSIPTGASVVTGTYTFVAVRAANTALCPYTDVHYNTQDKYDNNFCQGANIVNITGTLSISMSKSVNSSTVEQGQLLTYTLRYTNNGNLPLGGVYLWDTIPAQTVTATISPAPDSTPGFNTTDRVVWNVGDIPASGNPGATGMVTLTVLVNGRGSDLPNGTSLVNNGYLGILFNPDAVEPAITSTVTTTVLAPTIAISKSDNETNVVQGQLLTYTLTVTNSDATAATNMVITDVLPTGLTYSGGAVPAPSGIAGQTLAWTVASLAGNGNVYSITLPVSVDYLVANGTALTNSLQVKYSNLSGAHTYFVASTTDVDVVQAPVLTITKTSTPNPALIGRALTYTLNVANTGSAVATNVIVTDAVPINTTFQSCSGAGCGLGVGDVVSWTLPSLAVGASATLTMSVQITTNLASGATIVNQSYGVLSTQTPYTAGAPQTTIVRAASAKIIGKAFVDANVNGQLDAGEAGIPNVAMALPGALLPNTTTDASGNYTFTLEQEIPVVVSADLPAGYFRTTTSPVYLTVTLETTTTVDFGYNLTTSDMSAIIGVVFHDLNHNGVQDAGENGLSGVNIASTGAITSPVTTNSFGQYTLAYDTAGTYTVTETNPPLYVSTTPDTVSQVLALNTSETVNFGDFLGIRIEGQVFDDQNVNGADDAEPGLANVTVSSGFDSTTTDGSGNYVLYSTVQTGLPVTITETDPAGYVSTAALPGSAGVIVIDTNTLRVSSPASGQTYLDNNFGDVLATGVVTITGQIFDDINADGLRNETGTPGLPNGRVTASTGMFITTTTTGDFALYAPPGVVVTVTETNPNGYVSTNAIAGDAAVKYDLDTIRVSPLVAGTASHENYFGDVVLSSAAIITGILFNDSNNNGLFEAGEGVFPGEIVQISGTVSLITTTVSDGTYQFAVGVGDFLITSAVPPGYYRTTPEQIALRTAIATTYPHRNFGFSNNPGVANIYGTVFDDYNGDGLQQLGELPLPGAVIRLFFGATAIATATTGITSTYSFSVSQPGVYTVRETNPPGYFSTSPDQLNQLVALGNSYALNFGDSNRADVGSVHGLVYIDANANGVQDFSEVGLAGALITTTSDSGAVISVTTAAQGQYSYGFDFVSTGAHTVNEVDPPGYRSTTPNHVPVIVLLGSAQVVDFGDCLVGSCSSVITGIVFDDANGDGNQDFIELGISEVAVALYNGVTFITSTVTRAHGDYTFAVDTGATYRVIETDPLFYHSTTPNEVHVAIVVTDTYHAHFGDSRSANSSVFGTVYHDTNVNSAFDATEVGLANVTVAITGSFSGNPIVSVTTNGYGQYTFLIDQAGLFTVTETDLPGYVSTTPNVVTQTVEPGSGYNKDFGDVLASTAFTVTGSVWDDTSSPDGIRSGEPGLPGVTVGLNTGMSIPTDASGNYTLYGPGSAGALTVTETNLPGYLSTGANPGVNALIVTADVIRVNGVSAGGASSGNQFGDALAGSVVTVTGHVFNDLNANMLDDAEPGLSGVTISYPGGSTLTAGSGDFSFYTLAGTFNITETNPSGFVSTVALAGAGAAVIDTDHVQVTAPGGSTISGISFGDYAGGSGNPGGIRIEGKVFNDLDLNLEDNGEPGIAGVTITVSSGVGGVTDGFGNFVVFAPSNVGPITVTETDLAGYVSTVAIAGSGASVIDNHRLRINAPISGTIYSGNKFGDNGGSVRIEGVVFNDLNANGLDDDGQVVAGAVIMASGGTSMTTGITGTFVIFAPSNTGPVTITEIDPAGFVSTVAIAGNAATVIDANRLVITAPSNGLHSLGNKFGDYAGGSGNPGGIRIEGRVFDDANANRQDDSEAGVSGAVVSAANGTTYTTTSSGDFVLFAPSHLGPITITETDPTGFVSTVALAGAGASVVDENRLAIDNPISGTIYLGNKFGDYAGGSGDPGGIRIEGRVFDDANANRQDDSEAGVSGAVVSAANGTTYTTTSSGDFVLFAPSHLGPITITETDPTGFVSTVALAGTGASVVDENHLAINTPISGTIYLGNKFGDYAGGSGDPGGIRIEGRVFDDANANLLDDAEPGLSGVTITVSAGAGGVSDGTGKFILFAPSNAGSITFAETEPAGYVSTVALAGSGASVVDANHLAINNPISGTTYLGNAFGDFFGVRVLGSIFSDRNVNGQWDLAYEPVITATSITLAGSGGLTAATGSTGVYILYAHVINGFVTVTETVPAGYVATTPVSLSFAGTPGEQHTNKDFGLLPPDCGADAYEALADDFFNTTGVTLTLDGAQVHNFHRYDDKDWVEVNLQQDAQYIFTTVASGPRADTVLQLFAPDGVTLLASNDDFGSVDFSSQINWTAQLSGLHYLRVTQRDVTQAGCGTQYNLRMTAAPRHTLYLPLLMKNFP